MVVYRISCHAQTVVIYDALPWRRPVYGGPRARWSLERIVIIDQQRGVIRKSLGSVDLSVLRAAAISGVAIW